MRQRLKSWFRALSFPFQEIDEFNFFYLVPEESRLEDAGGGKYRLIVTMRGLGDFSYHERMKWVTYVITVNRESRFDMDTAQRLKNYTENRHRLHHLD